MTDERRVRRLFASARRKDEASAPSFREVLRRDRSAERAVRTPLVARLAALAILLSLVGVLAVRQRVAVTGDDASSAGELFSSGSWSGPTDFLLVTPGRDLLLSVPRIAAPKPLKDASTESKKGIRT